MANPDIGYTIQRANGRRERETHRQRYMFWKWRTSPRRWIRISPRAQNAVILQAATNRRVVECKPNPTGLRGVTGARWRWKSKSSHTSMAPRAVGTSVDAGHYPPSRVGYRTHCTYIFSGALSVSVWLAVLYLSDGPRTRSSVKPQQRSGWDMQVPTGPD